MDLTKFSSTATLAKEIIVPDFIPIYIFFLNTDRKKTI